MGYLRKRHKESVCRLELGLLCSTSMTHHIHDPELLKYTAVQKNDVTTQRDQVQLIPPDLVHVQ